MLTTLTPQQRMDVAPINGWMLPQQRMQAVKELNADLKKMKVEVDQKAVGRRQTETLNHIFATYFRVVKHGRDSPLLPCVLQGLSRSVMCPNSHRIFSRFSHATTLSASRVDHRTVQIG
jgi:hypothetical protein